jgi:putative hemolysin
VPLTSKQRIQPQEIAPAVPAGTLAAEIARLEALQRSGDLSVYLAAAETIPNTLREIGRLREIAFRAAGEGTGMPLDLDEFDRDYLHLFVWHAGKREIAGAYRLARTDAVPKLYTATLFRYSDEFLRRIGPAVELGRSFVRVEYQRSFGPLLLLWKGIGRYLKQNPRYKVLFGPVSISNGYQAISRELMVSFLEKYAWMGEWSDLVRHRCAFRRAILKGAARPAFPRAGFDVEDLSAVVAEMEPCGEGIPVLLRQYLKLGGKLLGFNVDPQFANALDGLILVDLTKTEPKLLERYLGKDYGTL